MFSAFGLDAPVSTQRCTVWVEMPSRWAISVVE
jgi:hypothetical protein